MESADLKGFLQQEYIQKLINNGETELICKEMNDQLAFEIDKLTLYQLLIKVDNKLRDELLILPYPYYNAFKILKIMTDTGNYHIDVSEEGDYVKYVKKGKDPQQHEIEVKIVYYPYSGSFYIKFQRDQLVINSQGKGWGKLLDYLRDTSSSFYEYVKLKKDKEYIFDYLDW